VQWQPAVGFTLGGSAARGVYLADAALASVALVGSRENSTLQFGSGQAQHALGVDAEYSRDYWMVRGEMIWNRWQVPTLTQDLNATSLFVEGRYKILPGMFVAGRIDRLTFSKVWTAQQSRTWDAPVTRVETGVGYYLRPNLLAKGAYQHNWRDGGQVRTRGLFAAQLHFWL
jgi:predicted porin